MKSRKRENILWNRVKKNELTKSLEEKKQKRWKHDQNKRIWNYFK